MANMRNKIDGKTKQREIKKMFIDDTQEEEDLETTVSTKSRIRRRADDQQPVREQLQPPEIKTEQMHTFSETGAGVPAFLAKLWRLVDDPDTNNLICWNKDGRSFIIQNQAQFARELLPLNYKHNNMASFIRQLNMYGFHKITSIDNGGLKFDRDEMEFSHPCFKRNSPFLLEHIKRKIANTKSLDEKSGMKPEAVTKVLQDVKAMRGRQDSLDSRFSVMKQENEALWREIASLRQKHSKQQQIVNKLIQFLITIVQPSRNMTTVKRHMQLMIHDTPDNTKLHKTSDSESDGGPVIHELGEELLDEVTDPDLDAISYGKLTPCHDVDGSPSPLHAERPHSSISQISQHYDYSNQSAEDAVDIAITTSGDDGGIHLDSTQIPGATSTHKLATGIGSAIIQSVNPDGSHIFYHVTEVPDATDLPPNDVLAASPNYNEENVLTTPMVREQMARSQQLKQKNKRRRGQVDAHEGAAVTAPNSGAAKRRSTSTLKKLKAEKDTSIDPMSFLNTFSDEQVTSPLISPTINNESHSSNASGAGILSADNIAAGAASPVAASNNSTLLRSGRQTTNFYNTHEFLTGDMPADLFEETPLISSQLNNYNQQESPQQQQLQYERATTNGDKFSSYTTRNNNNNGADAIATTPNEASTSAAAAAAAATNQFTNGGGKHTSNCTQQGEDNNNGDNMTVAKYKSCIPGNGEIMRDEVNNHLDNVHDELESLKDLLRSDGYSLDANTLLGNGDATNMIPNNRISLSSQLDGDFLTKLFNDSDVLGPYNFNFSNDGSNERKGSELMTYQPMYDLSDIIDINDKNELEDQVSSPSSSRQLTQMQQQHRTGSSGLNTPYRD